jgi:DNA polymerase V
MKEIKSTKTIIIPRLISAVRCGYANCLEDGLETIEIEVPSDFIVNSNNYYAVTASGDSMLPTVDNGDELLVSIDMNLRSGDMALAYLHGDLTVKRYHQRGFSHFLVPENKTYEEIKVDENAYLVGKVFKIIKEVQNIKE